MISSVVPCVTLLTHPHDLGIACRVSLGMGVAVYCFSSRRCSVGRRASLFAVHVN